MRLALRETMIGFRRAPVLSVLSITTIAFSLFAFGLFSRVARSSRLPVGSSAISANGSFTSARAIATRCCSPPDSSRG